ncbi:hypothetical protein CEXT_166471 [Caerostris extrusa]|uniref:Uncharacterized protein n=1 Tax=Caerostris extrusa TaxID=172846 RepID=A0AAV4V5N8_CAEEX|nr:hypothetical protein CEXT_166471 [Caerostris extrusa]
MSRKGDHIQCFMKRLFNRNHYASSLPSLPGSLGSPHYSFKYWPSLLACQKTPPLSHLFTTLPFPSANDFKNKRGAGQAMDE